MLTVEQCLALPELSLMRIAAGSEGLTRTVEFCHVIEEPDVEAWVSPGLFALSAGHPIKDDESGQRWLKELHSHGVTAVAVALGRYLEALPQSMIDEANQLGLPLFEVPWEIPFVKITGAIHREIIQQQTTVLHDLIGLQQRITQAALSASTQSQLLRDLSRITNRDVTLVTHQAHSGQPTQFPLPSMPTVSISLGGSTLSPLDEQIGRQVALVASLFLLREQIQLQLEWDTRSRFISRFLSDRVSSPQLGWIDDYPWDLNPSHDYLLLALTMPSPTIPGTLQPNPEFSHFRRTIWQSFTETHDAFLTIDEPHNLLVGVVDTHTTEETRLVRQLDDIMHRYRDSCLVLSNSVKIQELVKTYDWLVKLVPFAIPGRVNLARTMIYPTVVAGLPEAAMTILVNATWSRVVDPKLRETLTVWMEEAGNRRHVIARLKIHRNTLKNRLNRIEKLMGRNLTPELLTQLQLARDWERASQKSSGANM